MLTYQEEDIYEDDKYQYTLFSVMHKSICDKMAYVIDKWINEKGELNWDE